MNALHAFSSSLLYSIPYVALLASMVALWTGLDRRNRLTLMKPAMVSLLLALVYAAAIHMNPWASDGIFYHKDDFSYDRWGWEIAQSWADGIFPALASEAMIGSLHTGYYRFIAALYLIFGHKPLLILGLNLLACAFLPVGLFFLTREMFGAEAAGCAAWLGALYPTFWFHSSFVLRDVWITLFFVAALVALLRMLDGKAIAWNFLCLIFFLFQLFILRFYVALILVAAWGLYELALGERRQLALRVSILLALLMVLARLSPTLAHWQNRMFQSMTWAIPETLATYAAVFERIAVGLLKVFLAPLAWATEGGYTVDYFLWPGQWVLYLLLLPLGLWGMSVAVRRNEGKSFLLIFAMFIAAFGFAIAYGGSVPRQRMFLDGILIVYAASAWVRGNWPEKRFLIAYYGLLLVLVVGHVVSLFVRGTWPLH